MSAGCQPPSPYPFAPDTAFVGDALTLTQKKQNSEGRIVGAICAAPAVVLASHGLLEGKQATCYPASVFQCRLRLVCSIAGFALLSSF